MQNAVVFTLMAACGVSAGCIFAGCKRKTAPPPAPRAATAGWKTVGPPPDVATMDEATLASWAGKGAKYWLFKGCNACHSVDGTRNTGPTAKGVWGKKQKLADGTEVLVDEAYIREATFEPAKMITAGYQNQMASYQGRIDEHEMAALVAYYRSLAETSAAPGATGQGPR